jgi:hypothetical protein
LMPIIGICFLVSAITYKDSRWILFGLIEAPQLEKLSNIFKIVKRHSFNLTLYLWRWFDEDENRVGTDICYLSDDVDHISIQ